ncbi:unnamed protein product [Acanthoscelides obtectus]|uniref:Uncharacterized protein n=1 Tax=Acanthoscelides obtectus TaxID=200917 RepID=A0A9P0K3V9_ACAOB|nr:unnamed protein product [Acanthoscelides obtectus]CAK1652359.1 hypothetical protein AOBTE_LOCUS17805 [Acanthoscelides obtectus]
MRMRNGGDHFMEDAHAHHSYFDLHRCHNRKRAREKGVAASRRLKL